MAKPQIKFKTVLSSLTKGGKPCYSVRVINNGTEYLADSSQMKEIARLINMNVPFAKTTSEIVLEKAIELALTGKRVETEMFSMYLTVRGGFAKTTEKWNPAKHSLHLVINLKGALKEKMSDIEFVNVSETIPVGEYKVMLAARNGEGLERGVGVACKKITMKGAK